MSSGSIKQRYKTNIQIVLQYNLNIGKTGFDFGFMKLIRLLSMLMMDCKAFL